jgi:hypothetical protein
MGVDLEMFDVVAIGGLVALFLLAVLVLLWGLRG